MGHMVVELKIVVDNRVICMIQLEQVLQSSCSLFMSRLNRVDHDRLQIDRCPGVASQEAGQTKGVRGRGE